MQSKAIVEENKLVVEQGALKFSCDLTELFQDMDVESCKQVAEALTWDWVLVEAIKRLVGDSDCSGGSDGHLTLGLLGRMEYALAGRSWTIIGDMVRAAQQIKSYDNVWSLACAEEDSDKRYYLIGWLESHRAKLRPNYPYEESVEALREWLSERFKEAFPEKSHIELEMEASTRIHARLMDMIREVEVNLLDTNSKGAVLEALNAASLETSRLIEEEVRRLLGLHPELLAEV